jgi:hypothetical protein
MSDDYIVYHSATRMGDEYTQGSFGIVTSKPIVKHCKGDTVWLIAGSERPVEYTLECFFVIDKVEPTEDEGFEFMATGTHGRDFDPPIVLNHRPWFQDLFIAPKLYSMGFSRIKPELLRCLKDLAKQRSR